MKKEKQVRSYKRRTKSGKTVTVKAHTAKYEAADEKAKEVSKKPGAGKELEERKKKPVQLELPFDKEEEKKVLDEVKGEEKKSKSEKPAEKKTTKKVRPVGSGTNGPTPKRKSEAKSATDGISKSSGAEITKAIGEKRAHLLFEKALDKGSASVRKGGVKYTISIEDRKDGTYAVYTKQGGSSMTGTTKATKSASAKTTAKPAISEPAFTAAEFKEWYRGTGSAADKKVAKALRAQLGRTGYRKLEDEAIDNYSSRGHLSMFKRVSGAGGSGTKTVSKTTDLSKVKVPKGYKLTGKPRAFTEDGGKGHKVSAINKNGDKVTLYRYDDTTAKKYGENNKIWSLEFGSEIPAKKSEKVTSSATTKRDTSKTSKRKGPMVASGPDDFKSFLKLPKPEKGSKGYAVHMALRSVARAGIGTDDSVRDALVRNGYPKDKAYSKGVEEVVALAKKYGLRI